MQIWCASLWQLIDCDFATASIHAQQDISCKVAQQLSASAALGAAQRLFVQQQQQQQQQQHHQHYLIHIYTHTMTNHVLTLKSYFSFNLCTLQPIVSDGSRNQLPLGWFP